MIDEDDNLKISDFGLSSICKVYDNFSNSVGSRAFMAPELFAGKQTNYCSNIFSISK